MWLRFFQLLLSQLLEVLRELDIGFGVGGQGRVVGEHAQVGNGFALIRRLRKMVGVRIVQQNFAEELIHGVPAGFVDVVVEGKDHVLEIVRLSVQIVHACTAGPSTVIMVSVQSPVAPTMICGLGAAAAAISMLEKSTRSPGAFSHKQPPCMECDTITHGATAASRSSIAPSIMVCVPPPDSPVMASRDLSTSGRRFKKIEGADAVPRLQPHERHAPQPVFPVRPERPVLGNLPRIVVAHHVIGKGHATLPRKRNCARRNRAVRPVRHAPVVPMAVRDQNAGMSGVGSGV